MGASRRSEIGLRVPAEATGVGRRAQHRLLQQVCNAWPQPHLTLPQGPGCACLEALEAQAHRPEFANKTPCTGFQFVSSLLPNPDNWARASIKVAPNPGS
jgi:hypothetical protein